MVTFKTRARTLDMLGRQQIAGIPTAISELFKNAHDAYASRVEIDYYRSDGLFVLRDDGIGMTRDDFVSRWLTIGTESKFDPTQLPPRDPTMGVRPMLGEKGIGRLAIATIGAQVLADKGEDPGRSVRPHGRVPQLGHLRVARRGPRRDRSAGKHLLRRYIAIRGGRLSIGRTVPDDLHRSGNPAIVPVLGRSTPDLHGFTGCRSRPFLP